MSVNEAVVLGFIGADPEVHNFDDGGKVCNLSVATTEKWKDKQTGEPREHTDWHRVVVRGGLAGVVEQYVTKGMKVYVSGKMRTRKYQDSAGVDRYVTEIQADKLEMLGGGSNSKSQTSDDQWYQDQAQQDFSQNPVG